MIRRYCSLLAADGRQMLRDPMMAFVFAGPPLLWAALRFGAPAAIGLAEAYTHQDLSSYTGLILCFAALLVPLLMGMVTGLVLLDERDEGLIQWYAVSPLTKKGYFLYRLLVPTIMTVVYGAWILAGSGLAAPAWSAAGPMLLMLGLEAPFMALMLAAIASNKLEGLALTKGIGLLVIAPVLVYLVPWPWKAAAAVLPTFWPTAVFQAGAEGNGSVLILSASIGFVYHIFLIVKLLRMFSSKID